MSANQFETDLPITAANYQALSPLGFLAKAAFTYPDYTSVIDGPVRYTWAQTKDRCLRLASALAKKGVGKGDTVSVMAPNVTAAFEATFGVPMQGAVLNALNYRLNATEIAFILDHAECKLLITDTEFSPIIEEALAKVKNRPMVIDIEDPAGPGGKSLGEMNYETFLETGEADHQWSPPDDEWQAISLNYTSGTTGNPKGVVYSHRGTYLNTMGNIVAWHLPAHPVYLWTLPMFHCNGWCFTWSITAIAGTHVCLRNVLAADIYNAIAEHEVTHMCGAPIVMQMVAGADEADKRALPHTVNMFTAAAPPPAAVLADMARQGFNVTHVYGLTEVYGPCVISAWKSEWDVLPTDEQARLKARQGVAYQVQEAMMVADPETMQPVAMDGKSMGEVVVRGNVTMKGYLKNPKATKEAFAGGWFHTGDLGVWHPDGYVELKDRSKDIIISGGENISSIEVEDILYANPKVAAVAVVAKPDEKWGETPTAFIELKPGEDATAEEIIAFCRENMAHYKCPREVIFDDLPKTSTGKIQKFVLRDRARGASS
ncbi:MAG: acyl-CoA synthetase [Alphaproteobacteria bacterium]|nr:acyl-CoA synthetase [Alphaproteobacteria bacterium]MDP6253195.1 acyl-CoA synthetase [Alphaproteobacteria bacterium]MDP7056744.1 acyl-CoA synthetase [Alphaproteobacteria bacterium]MDP7230669.1 acyl-CoA synthetase [Alphaproteobacteria bacterium]MDP7461250.1 acyl-CoA synthetase [Alphaproteobacteria bacterium]